jgi:hypothetical protein
MQVLVRLLQTCSSNQEDLLDWQAWQPFLSVYTAGRRDDPDFERRQQGYLALFPVFWLGILLADGVRRCAAASSRRG